MPYQQLISTPITLEYIPCSCTYIIFLSFVIEINVQVWSLAIIEKFGDRELKLVVIIDIKF